MSKANVSTVKMDDGREVCLSYGVPVAAFIPGRGYVRTSARYSVTTSRHMNSYAGASAPELSPEDFAEAVAPIRVPR